MAIAQVGAPIRTRFRIGGIVEVGLPGLLTLVAVVLVVAPVVVLVFLSFYSSTVFGEGKFTVAGYASLLSQGSTWTYLGTTAIYTLLSAALAVALGTIMAFAVSCVELPFRGVLRLLPIGSLLLPDLIKQTSWIMGFSPTTGLANAAVRSVSGTDATVFNVMSLPGMIIVAGIFGAPLCYLLVLGPMAAIDRSQVEASQVSGASLARMLRSVIVPAVLPAVLSAAVLQILLIGAGFETPVLIGAPSGITTYISLIYQSVNSPTVGLNVAATQSVIYLVVSLLVVALYGWSTRNERRFATIGGKGARGISLTGRGLRYSMAATVFIYSLLSFIGPVVITALVSFLPFYSASNGNPFHDFTLANYAQIINDSQILSAVGSSSLLAGLVAVGCLILGGLLSYIGAKTQWFGRRVIGLLGVAPAAVPGTIYGVAFFITVLAIRPLTQFLYGSLTLMVLAEIVVFLPVVTRLMSSSILQIQDDLLDASTASGARRWRTIAKVVMPLLRPAIIYALVFTFMLSYREVGAVVFLVAQNTQLVPYLSLGYILHGSYPLASALNLLTLMVPLVVAAILFPLGSVRGRDVLRSLNSNLDTAVSNDATEQLERA